MVFRKGAKRKMDIVEGIPKLLKFGAFAGEVRPYVMRAIKPSLKTGWFCARSG
jgi:hypothetical protein